MINVEDYMGKSSIFNKFAVDDLLFVEIGCPVEDESSANRLWWHNNFFAYALSGEMVLKTLRKEYIVKAGDCFFAKKGSIVPARHRIRQDFCELRVVVPDDFIKSVFQKYNIPSIAPSNGEDTDTHIPLAVDDVLEAYFHSLLSYFRRSEPPASHLLKLKIEELMVNILSNNTHRPLNCFLSELCRSSRPSIKEIMEANFFSNLSLVEFARLCARSLSSFKQEFKSIYHTTPGRWLREKRLEYSLYLLATTDNTLDEICYMSGFENSSHYIRVFKDKYGLPPGRFKMEKIPSE